MTQAQLRQIPKGGLIDYVKRGFPLSSLQFLDAFAKGVRRACLDQNTFVNKNSIHTEGNKTIPATTFSLARQSLIIKFNLKTDDFITGYRLSKPQFRKYMSTILNYTTSSPTMISTE